MPNIKCQKILGFGVIAIGLLAFDMCSAQEIKTVPASQADINYSYAPVVKKAAPAVVNIYTRGKVLVRENVVLNSPLANDPFFRQFFAQNNVIGSRTREQVTNSLGSGVIVSAEGMIVTAHHVVKDAQEVVVALADKREFPAKIVIKDPQADLAFLKIDAGGALPFLPMRNSDTLEVGDLVLAIGNPFGVGQTVTGGIVSALARKAAGVSDYQYFIQTDAAINPGNSGGALVDMQGRLIGINTAIYSTSGASLGIGFAIPANMVKAMLEGQVAGGRVVRPWLGIAVQPVTAEIAESLGMKTAQGVLVKKLSAGSPAEAAGLKAGDAILAVNGAEIGSAQDLQYRLAIAKIGEKTVLQVMRGGALEEITVTPVAPPENPKRDQRTLGGRHPFDGVTVANLSPALAIELGMDENASGVIVMGRSTTGIGVNVGLQPGDVILEVSGTKITSTQQLETLMKTAASQWQIAYARGGQIMTLTVRL